MRFQKASQVQVTAVDRIGHDPGKREVSLEDALEHLHCQFRFGLEAHRLRDAGGLTPLTILTPVQRQIEFTVNQRMPTGRDVSQKDPDLTVLAAFLWFRSIALGFPPTCRLV
jgi:hypothetical protein